MTGSAKFRSTFLAGPHSAAMCRWSALLSVLMLAACAGAAPQPSKAQSTERQLFTEVDQSILEYHIKPVEPEQLALDGLAHLPAIDPRISFERQAGAVVLQDGSVVRRFATPAAASDLLGWSTLTENVIEAARAMSPVVAAEIPGKLDEIVIDGSLAKLDPYSRYVRPAIAREHRAIRDGFGGIGITLDIHASDVRIAGVLPDTPAASAGLTAGDRIVALDGVPVARLSADAIRDQLRGPVHTMVQLAVARPGLAEPLQVVVQRTHIVPETVTLREKDGIAWLKVRLFNERTGQSLADLLRKAHRDLDPHLQGIVLDLRDNPGGLLDQAVDVASLFLRDGDVLSTIGRNPLAMQHFTASGNRRVETAPLAVLVNGGSASASEIVASALQDSGRAVVIGTASYGKGTVQTVVRTSNDGELTVTWAQIITAGGYPLNTHGVVPTICTSDLADTPANAAKLLADAARPVPAALAEPRAGLDDRGWQVLRSLCPARRDDRRLDTLVAERLVDDPALYGRAIASLQPAAARLAVNR